MPIMAAKRGRGLMEFFKAEAQGAAGDIMHAQESGQRAGKGMDAEGSGEAPCKKAKAPRTRRANQNAGSSCTTCAENASVACCICCRDFGLLQHVPFQVSPFEQNLQDMDDDTVLLITPMSPAPSDLDGKAASSMTTGMHAEELSADQVIKDVFLAFASVANHADGRTKEVDFAAVLMNKKVGPEVQATAEVREAEQCLEEGVELRSKWGLRFARAADGAKNPGYRGCRAEKLAFRRAWLAAKVQEMRREMVQVTESAKIDESVGVYRPMSIIYRNQGGDKDPYALKATLNYVARCIKMGEPWLKYNDWTLRMEYLEVESRKIECFKRAWQSYERRMLGGGGSSTDGNDRDKDCGSAGQPEAPSPAAKDMKASKQNSELDKWWAAALATRKGFSAVVMAGDGVIHRSTERTSKSWATRSTDIDVLKDSLASLRKGLGSFGSDFVMKDTKQVRKEWKNDEAVLTTACRLFSKETEIRIAEVSCQTRLLIAMRDARVAIE